MSPEPGGDADDWFAQFERQAREAAQRDAETDAVPPAPPEPGAVPPVPQEPVAPLLSNPFDAPVAPPLVEPPLTEAPGMIEPEPTQAMEMIEPEPTQATPTRADEPTQALVPAPLRPPRDGEPSDGEPVAEEPGDAGSGTALDSLFGDERFREYDSTLGPDPSNSPFVNRARSKELVRVAPAVDETPVPDRQFGRLQKVLLGVGGGLVAVLALIALFLLGTRLPDLLGPAPAVVLPTPTPTPTPTRVPLAIGPVDPGDYDWDELLGGECLEPFDVEAGAWAEEYTVVDCATPHAAQMVYRAWFPAEPVDPEDPDAEPVWADYPGEQALAAQMTLLCSAPGVIDLAAAGAYTDIQVQGSYPMSAEQWETDPSYFCFVTRSSGEPLTATVAIPRA